MNFGQALDAARDGHCIRRHGWNNPDAFVLYVKGTEGVTLRPGTPYHAVLGDMTANITPHLDMIYPPNATRSEALCIPGWLASQSDMLADDWMVIP